MRDMSDIIERMPYTIPRRQKTLEFKHMARLHRILSKKLNISMQKTITITGCILQAHIVFGIIFVALCTISEHTPLKIFLFVIGTIMILAGAIIGMDHIEYKKENRRIEDEYLNDRQALIELLNQPYINRAKDTIRFRHEFLDLRHSTSTHLVFNTGTGDFMTHYPKYNSLTPAENDIVRQYIRSERLSDDEVINRAETAHSVAKHRESEAAIGFAEKLYSNANLPIDTPYYRSLVNAQSNIDAELIVIKNRHSANLDKNTEIIEQIQTKG